MTSSASGHQHQQKQIHSLSETCEKIAVEVRALSKQLLKVEKEFGPVKTALGKLKTREAATPNAEAAANSVGKILQRVKDVRLRSEEQLSHLDSLLFAHEAASRGRVSVVEPGQTSHDQIGDSSSGADSSNKPTTTTKSSSGWGVVGLPLKYVSNFSSNNGASASSSSSLAITRRDIVEYLACRGHHDLALNLAQHYQIPLSLVPSVKQDQEQEEELRVLLNELQNYFSNTSSGGECEDVKVAGQDGLNSCIAWAESQKALLSKENGNLLLVMLRIQQLLQLIRKGAAPPQRNSSANTLPSEGESQAENASSGERVPGGGGVELLSFVATYLLPHAPAHPTLVQDAATCATHPPTENYKGLYDEVHRQNLVDQMKRDVAAVRREKNRTSREEAEGKTGSPQMFPALARHCLCAALSAKDLVPSEEEILEAASRTERSGLEHPKVPHTSQLLRNLQAAVDPAASNRLVFRRGTQLFCCVTGKAMVNPRVLTTTGTIVSEEGYKLLIAAAAKEQTEEQARQGPPVHVTCPLTGTRVQVRNVKKMFVV